VARLVASPSGYDGCNQSPDHAGEVACGCDNCDEGNEDVHGAAARLVGPQLGML
jgi:hypothetical protein